MKIGGIFNLMTAPEGNALPTYRQIREAARRMEEGGLESIWLWDHFLFRPEGAAISGAWECWSMLSALAEVTERVDLGPFVLCTQFRNPAIVAKMAATVAEISHGRLVLGLGAGWNQAEFDAFGIPPSITVSTGSRRLSRSSCRCCEPARRTSPEPTTGERMPFSAPCGAACLQVDQPG